MALNKIAMMLVIIGIFDCLFFGGFCIYFFYRSVFINTMLIIVHCIIPIILWLINILKVKSENKYFQIFLNTIAGIIIAFALYVIASIVAGTYLLMLVAIPIKNERQLLLEEYALVQQQNQKENSEIFLKRLNKMSNDTEKIESEE